MLKSENEALKIKVEQLETSLNSYVKLSQGLSDILDQKLLGCIHRNY